MKITFHFCGLAIILWTLPGTMIWAKECHHTHETMKCLSYLGNYDGDTVTFDIPNVHPLIGEKITVRIAEIDTAEIRSDNPCERQVALLAKERVASLLTGSNAIELRNVKRGKYFRILAQIYVEEVSLGEVLIEENLAVPYFGDRKPTVDWCEKLEKFL